MSNSLTATLGSDSVAINRPLDEIADIAAPGHESAA